MYDEVVQLGKSQIITDDFGNQSKTYTYTEVFAKVKSVSQSEFYSAAQSGFKPELKFIIADYLDYDNQDIVLYNDIKYRIIRTYRNGMELEITVQRFIESESNGEHSY